MDNRISAQSHPALAAEEEARIAAAGQDDRVSPEYRAKATEAATKFESFFISHLLHQMRNSTREMAGEDSVFKDEVNRDMLDMADNLVADSLAGRHAFGIADAILRQLLPVPVPVAPATQLSNISTEKKPGAAA